MDERTKADLIAYVKDQKTTQESIGRIKEFCQAQPPVSLVVYRGHIGNSEIRYNSNWYSATKSKKVAKEEFSSGDCCVFTIHLVDVPVIDVNKWLAHEIGDYNEEEEYIFLGGGTFYTDSTLQKEGVADNNNGEYECWYVVNSENIPFDIDRILSIIDEGEYDIIETPNDIIIEGEVLSEEQKQLVFDKIQQLKGGGRRKKAKKTKKTKKNKRQKTKRQRRR